MPDNSDRARAAADEKAREKTLQRLLPEVRTALQNAPDVRAWPLNWEDDEWVDYFYHSSSLLTRDRDLPRVQDALRSWGALREKAADAPAAEGPAEAEGRPPG